MYLLDRLQEKSTWLGLIAVASGFGVQVSPEHMEMIVSLGTVAAGTLAALTKG